MRLLCAVLALGACERAAAPTPRPAAVEPSGMKHAAMPVARASVTDASSLVVDVPAVGDVTVRGTAYPTEQLGNLFRAAFARDPDTQVVFNAGRGVPYARLIQVLDLATQMGLTRLAIGAAADPPPPPPP